MNINGVEIERTKLWTKSQLIQYLRENGENDRVLADVRSEYHELFGEDIIWRYPISDGTHMGMLIVPVQEGFLSLPYDEMESDDYEILIPDGAWLMTEVALTRFITDWTAFSDELLIAMNDMRRIVGEDAGSTRGGQS